LLFLLTVNQREFGLRENSGGEGAFRGGDGVVREIVFLKVWTKRMTNEKYKKVDSPPPTTQEMTVGILSERRSHGLLFFPTMLAVLIDLKNKTAPKGMNGGGNAKRGINLLLKTIDTTSGAVKTINLGGKNQVNVGSGDSIRILTPGGGGYGDALISCK